MHRPQSWGKCHPPPGKYEKVNYGGEGIRHGNNMISHMTLQLAPRQPMDVIAYIWMWVWVAVGVRR